ncbi:hypothetical protein SKAU_G00245730 [Synaphobranchus kaupii]|uniref:Uncharacterized protein n=1 Tax=Synaphobranchus kaupii TaxID=118154 RepID=A0A9Q1F1U0_SYNKA|nr:hypothetical protein SKAU_G00245730 [Synaphobranchus kaupii]
MKRKSTVISSYFKKKIRTGGEKETTGEQQRLSEEEEKEKKEKEEEDGGEEQTEEEDGGEEQTEEEDGGEEQTEQHDKDSQPASVTEHSDEEEHQTAATQGQSAPTMVTEVKQDSAKAGVRPVPGPTDISQSRAEQPKQPQLKIFPRTYQGDRRRCFSKDWDLEVELPVNNRSYCPPNATDSEDVNGNVVEGSWRQEEERSCLQDIPRVGANTFGADASAIRQNPKNYFISEAGEVPWQWEHVRRT